MLQIDGKPLTVEDPQIQPDAQGADLHAAHALLGGKNLPQMLIQIMLVIGLMGCRVHGTAIGDHEQDATLRGLGAQPLARPFHGLARRSMAKLEDRCT